MLPAAGQVNQWTAGIDVYIKWLLCIGPLSVLIDFGNEITDYIQYYFNITIHPRDAIFWGKTITKAVGKNQ